MAINYDFPAALCKPGVFYLTVTKKDVISFVSLEFCFPMILSIGRCKNVQYLQKFVGAAHTRLLE